MMEGGKVFLYFLVFISLSESRRLKTNFKLGDPIINYISMKLPPAQWFQQKLDHFTPTKYSYTWKQRYFVNDSFHSPGGPAFIMIGGEGPANPIWAVEGTWIEYAKKVGAICYQLEHRYYGESHPTPDMGVKNLVYLTSEQALADIAYFIDSMNSQKNISEWIAFGGSYPGTLAAWLRLKYPHLVLGSVSTSGPVLAKADFYEYLQVVDNVFRVTDPVCGPTVKEGMKEVEALLQHRLGWDLLSRIFRTCKPLDGKNKNDVANFVESVIGNFEDIVQYNRDNRGFEGIKRDNVTIETLCGIMTNSSIGKPVARLATVNSLILNEVEKVKCLDVSYSSYIQEMSKIEWKNSVGGRQWMYQTCTEFGWYQSSNQTGNPFGSRFPASFFEKQCMDIFGSMYNTTLLDEGIKRTNILYGGKNPRGIENVVFVHGSFDPWHAMGITHDLSDKATAILITGTAHCANMYPASSKDLPQLKKAREDIFEKIQLWLGNHQ